MDESILYDLTPLFVQAFLRKGEWDPVQVSHEARALIQHEGGRFYWSRASGEQWIALNRKIGDLSALIWTQGPLALIAPAVSDALRAFLVRHAALTLEVADWYADVYRINPAPIVALGLTDFWPGGSHDPERAHEKALCIADLLSLTDN